MPGGNQHTIYFYLFEPLDHLVAFIFVATTRGGFFASAGVRASGQNSKESTKRKSRRCIRKSSFLYALAKKCNSRKSPEVHDCFTGSSNKAFHLLTFLPAAWKSCCECISSTYQYFVYKWCSLLITSERGI